MLIKKNISNKANNVWLRNNLIYKLKNLFFNIFNGN
jgi:hypothetical protein